MNFGKQLKEGLLTQNPVLVQMLGLCSTMAITTSIANGVGMGVSVLIILTASNVVISAIREVLAYGTLWGFALPEPLRLSGAQMPFFGFIMFGVFSAGYQCVRRVLAELRRMRAVRPQDREGGEPLP